jgi:hypothetical protein
MEHGNLVIWSCSSAGTAFDKFSRIQCDGFPNLFGGSVRYVPSTRELFFSRIFVTKGKLENRPAAICIIKEFKLPGNEE